jgi:hypothetical protein
MSGHFATISNMPTLFPPSRFRHKCGRAARRKIEVWLAAGSKDTELGVFVELEVGHGELRASSSLSP